MPRSGKRTAADPLLESDDSGGAAPRRPGRPAAPAGGDAGTEEGEEDEAEEEEEEEDAEEEEAPDAMCDGERAPRRGACNPHSPGAP
jgi:hypothetical protein